ncbi:unnamed protein product [Adineta steineri]|uniref:C2H2-type domain-containing protein n=1 Tax=Adineta steineri TaxID=433720 RepID=A0A814VK86_9BILA|nr:unnamed protein product [Adineta steineri]CAF1189540.1 unnamed protein product [Adineta steineri]CAF1195063.1 unnamed protein product [Adineta steineri]
MTEEIPTTCPSNEQNISETSTISSSNEQNTPETSTTCSEQNVSEISATCPTNEQNVPETSTVCSSKEQNIPETSTTCSEQNIPETPTACPEQNVSETSTICSEQNVPDESISKPSKEKKSAEAVANPDFISWKYPPYCELCNQIFTGEPCSKLHFDGKSHKNTLQTWKKYQDPQSLPTNSKDVLCEICWKVMNTQAMLDIHFKSPAHIEKEKKYLIVQKLKEDYRQLKELQNKN